MAGVTAPVAGAATPAHGTPRTHYVVLDEDCRPVSTACLTIKASSILADLSQYTQARPTCPVCARWWDRWIRR